MRTFAFVAVIALLAGAACGDGYGGDGNDDTTGAGAEPTTTDATDGSSAAAPIVVTSDAFDDGQPIPRKFSCDGDNLSPALAWSGVPEDAQRLALVVDDPDAPSGTFVHWVVVNLPADTNALDEGASGLEQLPNGRGDAAWTGPCPPSGPPHHYRFTVYALPGRISSTDTDDALDEIDESAIARGTLTGLYNR
jgi:Raf kinase inhibitor-like YbhB/YbcL family protein